MSNETIPPFEGRPVDHVAVKISGAVPVEDLQDVVIRHDDLVQAVVIFRCTSVNHPTNKDGLLYREQTLKPVEMELLPFDETDPNDIGIQRAMPSGTVVAISGGTSNGGGTGDDDDD